MTAKQNVYISLIGKDNVSKTLKNVSGGLRRLRHFMAFKHQYDWLMQITGAKRSLC